MFCKILSGGTAGVAASFIWVEVDIDRGLPSFAMVGSLGSEVRESRERVAVALKNAGFSLPVSRITVNLAPADVHKEGTGFDLPIAVGILQSMAYFAGSAVENTLFLGELGLDGSLKKVRGALPVVRAAAKAGIAQCILPAANAAEGAVIPGIVVRGASHIGEVLAFLQQESGQERERILPAVSADAFGILQNSTYTTEDFSEIRGQQMAKRAAEIAAAGFHNLLMIGPPGAGKTMIARRIPGILPKMTLEESLEVTGIYSVAGLLEEGRPLIAQRPFQSPHHTVTRTALIGGGLHPRPGLVSLAHGGVLFLDELPEFGREVIDGMRQPLEEHTVHLSRTGGNISYPAKFMLVGAMNPCPCGYLPDRNRCRCTESQIKKYQSRISGPVLDRVDLWVELQAVALEDLRGADGEESSGQIRRRVERARKRQQERFARTQYRFNADILSRDMERFCSLGETQRRLVEQLYQNLRLGARAYHRMLRVARTIADLEGEEAIREEHLLEAAAYRPGQMVSGS